MEIVILLCQPCRISDTDMSLLSPLEVQFLILTTWRLLSSFTGKAWPVIANHLLQRSKYVRMEFWLTFVYLQSFGGDVKQMFRRTNIKTENIIPQIQTQVSRKFPDWRADHNALNCVSWTQFVFIYGIMRLFFTPRLVLSFLYVYKVSIANTLVYHFIF